MTTESSVILTKKLSFTTASPISKDALVKRLKKFTKNIVNYLKDNDSCKLGHVKFISTTDGEDYLQLSVLDLDQTPKISGFLRKTFEKIKITINIIAFGVDKEDIDRRINREITGLKKYFLTF
jgi:hypothetical protein